MIVIEILPSGPRGLATVRPHGHIPRTAFDSYVDAAKRGGARYDSARKCQVISIDRVEQLARALREHDFDPAIHPDIEAHLRAQLAVAAKDHDDALERLARVEADLAKRGMALFPYQRDGVRWLAPRPAALLADEMGLGKTVQALIALPERAACLVVAPAAVKGNWASETRRWRPDLWPTVLAGRGSFRWPKAGEVVICNYDILPEEAPAPARAVVIVADEAHALKTSKAARTQRFRALSDAARKAGGRTWLMTGTPLLNRPPELWGVLRAAGLERDAFGTWSRFTNLFRAHKNHWGGYEWGSPKPEVPECMRRVSLMRRRTEVLPDLPTKIYATVDVTIDEKTIALCDELEQKLRAAGVDLARPDVDLEALAHCEAIPFTEISRVRAALSAAKIPAILEYVEQFEDAAEPVVVFSAHRAPVAALGARDGWATITGDVDPAERTRIVEQFQAGELKGLAATIQAAGVGLTLTRAHQIVFVDRAWTPALNQQAEDRVCRIGQTRGVIVTRLVADHIVDWRVDELLQAKQALIEASVEASARATVGDQGAEIAERSAQLERALEKRHTPQTGPAKSGSGSPTTAPSSPELALRRPARTASEKWATGALLHLAALDTDHAMVLNDVGFNRVDNSLGHSLAQQLAAGRGLTDRQWKAAVRIATRYPRQVGRPETETASGVEPDAAMH